MEFLLQNQTGETFDVTDLVSEVTLNDNLNKSSVLTASIRADAAPCEGCRVRFTFDGIVYFLGVIFKTNLDESALCKLTAYDQLRYLTANETYVIDGETAADVLRRICTDFRLKTGALADTGYRITGKFCDGQGMLDILSDCLQLTAVHTNQLYFIKDAAGEIVLKNIRDTVTDLVIDPDYLLEKYRYERSIDSDSFNTIKLVKDDQASGKRAQYVARDSANIGKWGGILQYYEKLDDSRNAAQIKEQAHALLELKNRVGQTLSLDTAGDSRIRAGNVICIDIPDVAVKRLLLCTSAVHTFQGVMHTVKADFRLV